MLKCLLATQILQDSVRRCGPGVGRSLWCGGGRDGGRAVVEAPLSEGLAAAVGAIGAAGVLSA